MLKTIVAAILLFVLGAVAGVYRDEIIVTLTGKPVVHECSIPMKDGTGRTSILIGQLSDPI